MEKIYEKKYAVLIFEKYSLMQRIGLKKIDQNNPFDIGVAICTRYGSQQYDDKAVCNECEPTSMYVRAKDATGLIVGCHEQVQGRINFTDVRSLERIADEFAEIYSGCTSVIFEPEIVNVRVCFSPVQRGIIKEAFVHYFSGRNVRTQD